MRLARLFEPVREHKPRGHVGWTREVLPHERIGFGADREGCRHEAPSCSLLPSIRLAREPFRKCLREACPVVVLDYLMGVLADYHSLRIVIALVRAAVKAFGAALLASAITAPQLTSPPSTCISSSVGTALNSFMVNSSRESAIPSGRPTATAPFAGSFGSDYYPADCHLSWWLCCHS